MTKYNYLIVGAGLFGAVFTYEATCRGKKCLVIDKRSHVAGNIYTENINGINVHKYGAHIFRTNSRFIWDYVHRFAEFNNFINAPLASYGDKLYNLPFNMNTFYQLWGVKKPSEAREIINKQRVGAVCHPKNLEEAAISLVGIDLYNILIKGYTEKQWGRDCKDLPASIINRLPLRFIYDNNYYNDFYQGIPIGGYTQMVRNMLHDVDVLLNTEYNTFITANPNIAENIVYTGAIDEFFEYRFGALDYRSLRFNTQTLQTDNFQGNAVVNYTARNIPYTRIIEHKHFEFGTQPCTVITHEYPVVWRRGLEPYYPINDEKNNALYKRYLKIADGRDDLVFGGRLGQYKYFDMQDVISSALQLVSLWFDG